MQKLAGADHTTLLLNCYTKLKDVSKLDAFLRGSGATEGSTTLPFDAETAVKVGHHRVVWLCHLIEYAPGTRSGMALCQWLLNFWRRRVLVSFNLLSLLE